MDHPLVDFLLKFQIIWGQYFKKEIESLKYPRKEITVNLAEG